MLKYLKKVINSATTESSKRFMGVVAMLLFVFLFVELIVLLPFLLFKLIPASQTTINLYFALFDKVAYYNWYIVLFAIGAVTIVAGIDMISAVFKTKATADIISAEKGTPDTQVINKNVQQQNVGGATGEPQADQPNQEIKGG